MVAPRILSISPPDRAGLRRWLARAPALVAAGADALLLRCLEPMDAGALRRLTEPAFAADLPLILHLRTAGAGALAAEVGAAVHARAGARPRGLQAGTAWSQSTHGADALVAAADWGARFALLSPVYPPGSKPGDTRPVLGLDGLAALSAAAPLPVLALGGLTPDRAAACVAAGAAGVAGIAAFGEPESIRAISEALGRRRVQR